MAFESVPPIATPDTIVQRALRAGRSVKVARRRSDDAVTYARKKERERVTAIAASLTDSLRTLPRSFPSTDTLSEFYRELLSVTTDLDRYREVLGRIQESAKVVDGLRRSTRGAISAAGTEEEVKERTGRFIGRASSVVTRLKGDLKWLEGVRERLRSFPTVKERFTICIAGFPNVGKTTLLTRLTGSNAEINEYAFTTKSLNAGTLELAGRPVQFIDTPGTLNREHLNDIELQAHLALKYLADLIVYVFDPTEPYEREKQEALRTHMDEYEAPVLEYLSKRDIATQEQIAPFMQDHDFVDQETLLKEITSRLRAAHASSRSQ